MRILVLLLCGLLLPTTSQGAVVFGLTSPFNPELDNYSPTHLFRFSLNGESFVDLGPVLLNGVGADFDGLAASQDLGLFAFLSTPAGSRLVQINATAVTASVLSPPLFGREIRGATISDSGVLWAVDSTLDQLIRVSTVTGEEEGDISLSLNAQPFDVPQEVDLAFDFSGQLMLVAGRETYAVNPATGQMSILHSDTLGEPVPPSAMAPYAVGAAVGFAGSEKLFVFDVQGEFTDDVYTYDLANGFSRNLLLTAPMPLMNAGLGDLALLIQPVESGDYNGDGFVNAADYTLWRDTHGSTVNLAANGVDTGSSMSVINAADYQHWVGRFGDILGSAAGGGNATLVPETNLMLPLICMLIIYARRRVGWAIRRPRGM